jgi:2'-5' RNA ligase
VGCSGLSGAAPAPLFTAFHGPKPHRHELRRARAALARRSSRAGPPPFPGQTGRVRLFVAIWPPPPVVAALGDIEHPDVDVVRWTRPSRWHITLVFLGDVASGASAGAQAAGGGEATVDDAIARLERVPLAGHARTVARLGAVTRCFGRSVLYVPVTGLDAMAASVRTAYGSPGPGSSGAPPAGAPRAGAPPDGAPRAEAPVARTVVDPAPFIGHLTVGRSRRHRDDLRSLAGLPIGAAGGMAWTVDELALVASISRGGKGRYETVATLPVPGDDYPTSNMRSGLQ